MKQKNYETPSVFHSRIKVENSICSASSEVTNPDNKSGRIDEHSINTGFDADFSSGSWDTDPT
ncbi:MAG: hypothetical protein ACI4TJ_02490, partial [Candidatus Cryptobacteroides sp.]